jgi:hypothetical protein
MATGMLALLGCGRTEPTTATLPAAGAASPPVVELDSRAALDRLGELLPAVTLVRAVSSPIGALDASGRDAHWTFMFLDEVHELFITTGVQNGEVSAPTATAADQRCRGAEALALLDSHRVVPDALQRLNARLDSAFAGNLFFEQDSCPDASAGVHNSVLALERSSTRFFLVRYGDDGSFLELLGPCANRNADSCRPAL